MPWQTREIMSLKEEFVHELITNEQKISELCRKYRVSRPMAYKWLKRFKEEGEFGLKDRSRRPLHSPFKTEAKNIEIILKSRDKFPAWGAKKLRQYLINEGIKNLPCLSTFNRLFQRHGRIEKHESEKRQRFIRFEKEHPNELWQMDFKGHFGLPEGRCYPLTVLDDYSRYSICLQACTNENTASVRKHLENAFRTYGLPEAMTMDNGPPWKGSPPWHLTQITVWLMRLEIKVSHSRPFHPQTQGKDERFHRSLKEEVLKFHQFQDMDEAQHYFNEWRELYNNIRPHEGIGMSCPAQRYQPSSRMYPRKLPRIEYETTDLIRKVTIAGQISYKDIGIHVGEHFAGEYVAIRQKTESRWDVYYCKTRVGSFNLKKV